jgi:CheY-like chemotaxis protein/anti-sigma regulatory factor (Ser/Thr protein kinase)
MAYILVTDDSPVERQMAATLLSQHGDWVVIEAACAEQALMLAQLTPLDLVLTDVCMPEVDGLELLKQLKEEHPMLPVIMVTGAGSEEVAVEALQSGADGYITKRKLTQDLVDIVERVLAASQEDRVRASVLQFRTRSSTTFELKNDPSLVPTLVRHVVELCRDFGVVDERERVRVAVALEEALVNAVIHGNLEVGSELRERSDGAYERLIGERRRMPRYAERRVHVACEISGEAAAVVIRDEGPGFDTSRIPDPRDPERIAMASGRGVLLMRTFMDEVTYNAAGNEVTLVKRRAPVEVQAAHHTSAEPALCH